MQRTLGILFKAFLVVLVVAWVGLIIAEYVIYTKDLPMLAVIYEERIDYDEEDGGGYVNIYYGLGYKRIEYRRPNISGKEFGHFFIKVRDKID